MKLFLCSHFSSVGSLIKEEIENKKVAFIPTASLREGYTGYVGSARKLFKKLGAIVTEIDISMEAYSTIQSVFEDSDVIYFPFANSFFSSPSVPVLRSQSIRKKEFPPVHSYVWRVGGLYGIFLLRNDYYPAISIRTMRPDRETVPSRGYGFARLSFSSRYGMFP